MPSILTIAACVFGLMGMNLLWSFTVTWHWGLLLGGMCYLAGCITAQVLSSWWPLLVAFCLAWVLRLLGLDPDAR